MYIDPFAAGIIFTVLVEIVFSIALVITLSRKSKNDKEKE